LKDNSHEESVLVVTPRLLSKFSPAVIIGKSPAMKKKIMENKNFNKSQALLGGFAKKKDKKYEEKTIMEDNLEDEKEKLAKTKRKNRTSLIKKNLNETITEEISSKAKYYDDLPITEGVIFEKRDEKRHYSRSESEREDDSDDEKEEVKLEGYFYIRENEYDDLKYKKQWFKLFKKDLCRKK
jgi:hypothetical protein